MTFITKLQFQGLLLCLVTLSRGWQLFPDSEIGDYSEKCADALATNITSCIPAVGGISTEIFYSQHALDVICKPKCRDELINYEKAVTDHCHGVSLTNEWGSANPISAAASILVFNFDQVCLKNEGQYCNPVLGNLTQNGGNECNKCLLLQLRGQAQFPYGSGPSVYSSVYPSFTSSCKFTGHPATVSPHPSSSLSSTPVSSPSVSPTASGCSGTKYTIKEGDTCQSVSKSQSIATFQLLLDNNLRAYCANFPKEGDLCIKNKCSTYTVQKGDTCKSVAKAHNISTVQLRSYNPWIDGGCYNFNRTIGTEICMDEPGHKYHPPSSVVGSTAVPSTASTAVPTPTNVADNSTRTCGKYYEIKKGDNCDTIVQEFSISREDFLILNPGLDANCTNLLLGVSYCVLPVGDMENYPGAPGYMPSISKIPWDSLPDATYTPMLNPDKLPLAPRTVKDCATIFDGRDLQFNFPGVSGCQVVHAFWGVSVPDLMQWNPSLKGTSSNSTDCNFSKEYRYCIDKGTGAETSSLPTSLSSRLAV
ncbi:hypothetical protein ASPVEDRAFT_712823 [Aspergillus versicolor CBS 583.65]|uniref:LysM domain-containing protein n=1 Tax=Aspergillus versicolor CBS 583.65 TaxID=1036611 RepID=A0A1L9PNE5_ASPVE|nr:uncharacterized protein ASPVEDRAFT_712823 [Aspergillus versicolor CBS 583.65]OJJ03023.1 hypothetical protein ASPVEDRAFT_712823 [Aspergillus versicolor CBS 583.65]